MSPLPTITTCWVQPLWRRWWLGQEKPPSCLRRDFCIDVTRLQIGISAIAGTARVLVIFSLFSGRLHNLIYVASRWPPCRKLWRRSHAMSCIAMPILFFTRSSVRCCLWIDLHFAKRWKHLHALAHALHVQSFFKIYLFNDINFLLFFFVLLASLYLQVVQAPDVLSVIAATPNLKEFVSSLSDCKYRGFFEAMGPCCLHLSHLLLSQFCWDFLPSKQRSGAVPSDASKPVPV